MRSFQRVVEPEWLDELAAADPRAHHARRDLRKLNIIMGHASGIAAHFRQHWLSGTIGMNAGKPLRIVELGSGDGALMLRIGQKQARSLGPATLKLIDRQGVTSKSTISRLAARGWNAENVQADVFDWLSESTNYADIIFCNLFLHHFEAEPLSRMLSLIRQRTRTFIAFEPRRTRFASASCRLLRVIGCNDVTRHDAVVSVAAGFKGLELSGVWGSENGWRLEEHACHLFSHVFLATKDANDDRRAI